ncbi:MAG: hypothetical protein M3Y68_05820, partial [Chloroflexota bacterium]|nr:hypothetical protein [Chloroflexota bacterium]
MNRFTGLALMVVIISASCGPAVIESLPSTAAPTIAVTVTAAPTATATPVPASPTADIPDVRLIPARKIRAYPGPKHYAGDILTFEIPIEDVIAEEEESVELQLDNTEPVEVTGIGNFFNMLVLPLALDTTGLSGRHTVRFRRAGVLLNQEYTFEVLAPSERSAQEGDAAWTSVETDCCTFHVISNTAAERDIDFISGNFQQAAEDFVVITGETIDRKLDVYVLDRIWGNGGFGGDGQLVISYTDRYYGPTTGAEGLQTLARHEFSHAAGIGADSAGDGLEFNYEGLAVYIAGGHYKPEPLSQRGAALYDLGYFVPSSQFVGQHEASYLYSAVLLAYIAETYGEDQLWEFINADEDIPDGQWLTLEEALQKTFDIGQAEFDANFEAWLEAQDSGEQLDDLRLTIELQDLRREYQERYAPPPTFIFDRAEKWIVRPEFLPV